MTTVRLANGKDFTRGLKYAKQVGGRYNPDSKTWSIPDGRPELSNARAYGWQVISTTGGCSYYTRDQGCPMHGEACR